MASSDLSVFVNTILIQFNYNFILIYDSTRTLDILDIIASLKPALV